MSDNTDNTLINAGRDFIAGKANTRTTTMTITDFITAQLAQDEQLARDASGHTVVGSAGHWQPSPAGDEWEANVSDDGDEELLVALRPGLPRPPDVMGRHWGAIIGTCEEARDRDEASPVPQLTHAARHDPARVLLEVNAKRALLTQAAAMRELAADTEAWFLLDMATSIERALAAPYDWHPGPKPE